MKLDPVLRRFFEDASALCLTQREKSDMRAALQIHMKLVKGGVHLTAEERAEGKDALVTYMLAHPVQDPASLFARAYSFFVFRIPALALTALLVVAGGGAVVASAAESALPGDALYTVKVDILEPLRERIIRAPEKRMAWKVRKVERRLSEAKALQGRDRLTEPHRTFIERSIEREVAEIQDDAEWNDQEMVIASQQVLQETMDAASFEDDDMAEHREWRALKSFVRARRSEVHRSVQQRIATAYGSVNDTAASATGLAPESAVMLAPEPSAPTLMVVPVSDEPEDPAEAPVMMMRAKEASPVSEEDKQENTEEDMEEEKSVMQRKEREHKEEERSDQNKPEALQEDVSEGLDASQKKEHEEGMERLKAKREHIEKELRGLRKKSELLPDSPSL